MLFADTRSSCKMNFEELRQALIEFRNSAIAFVGLGNEMRGDDGAGDYFLAKLRQTQTLKGVHLIYAGTNPENYLQKILDTGAQAVVFVDAARFQAPPGTIRWLPTNAIDASGFSTHTYSISTVADYLNSQRPVKVFYLGIEPRSTQWGTEMSPEIRDSIDKFFS